MSERDILPLGRHLDQMTRRRSQHPRVQQSQTQDPEWFFRARVDVLNAPGQPPSRTVKTFWLGRVAEVGKRRAEQLRDEILADINSPKVVLLSQVPFKEVVHKYLRDHVRSDAIREVTRQSYESLINRFILPELGDLKMKDLDHETLQAWVHRLPKGAFGRRQIKMLFDQIWKHARLWRYTTAPSPAEFVQIGRLENVWEKRIPIAQQLQIIRRSLDQPYKDMFEVAYGTGMRISEIRGLRVKDCHDGAIWILRRKDRCDIELNATKTEKSTRVVPVGHLQALLDRKSSGKRPDDLVFDDAPGYSACQNHLRDAAKEAGFAMEGFGWHTLRRVFNTRYRKSGGSTSSAQDQLGHTTALVNDLYLVKETEDFKHREEVVRKVQEELCGECYGRVQ
jgi:integrase